MGQRSNRGVWGAQPAWWQSQDSHLSRDYHGNGTAYVSKRGEQSGSPICRVTRFQNGGSKNIINKCLSLKVQIDQLIKPAQSAVEIAMCSNYFKVANLKQSKVRIARPVFRARRFLVSHLLFFFGQSVILLTCVHLGTVIILWQHCWAPETPGPRRVQKLRLAIPINRAWVVKKFRWFSIDEMVFPLPLLL